MKAPLPYYLIGFSDVIQVILSIFCLALAITIEKG
jgi:hypothetical protein